MENKDAAFLNPEQIIAQIKLAPGSHIADLGCGTGYMSFAACRAVGSKGRVYAVDVQKAVLAQVKKEARMEGIENIVVVWSDLEVVGAAQIPPVSLDAVLLVNILFLVKDKSAVFSEAQRLLKPDGTLLVVEWTPGITAIGPPQQSRVPLEVSEELALKAGFVRQSEIKAGAYHYGLVFKQQ